VRTRRRRPAVNHAIHTAAPIGSPDRLGYDQRTIVV